MFKTSPSHESDASGEANICVPNGHASDPFACPCCANVFAELLESNATDLSQHARAVRCQPAPGAGSFFLRNAKLYTMSANALGLGHMDSQVDAMWVRDGKIAWVGPSAQAPIEAANEEIVDGKGRVVMPGFIEPHMHLAPLAMLRSFHDVGPFRFAQTSAALDHLREIAGNTAPGEWIVGRQFDPSLQEGPAYLTRDLLDDVSTNHPIFIYNASLHLAYCNSHALEIGGVTAATPDPAGAEIGREADGSPNGVLKAGPAMALVARHNPHTKQQNLGEACLGVLADAASLGITMICDQGTGLFQGPKELDLYDGLRKSNRMHARLRYSLAHAQAKRWDELGATWGEGCEWVRNTGWKIVSDGSNQGRTGLQRERFLALEGEPESLAESAQTAGNRGIAYIEVDELNQAVEERLRQGWAVCVHANGDAAIDRVLDAFERAKDLGLDPAQRRCRIEHCSILHDEQIERIAKLGVSPSFLIGHVYFWGQAFVHDVFGLEKASLLDRTGACEAKGIRWTLHSDDPVTQMGALRCIQNAVTRDMWRSDERLSPQECVSVEAALRAQTIDAAWQCHSDHEVGSLEVGKFADFVVLAQDPLAVSPQELQDIEVEQTWVNGRQVYASDS